MPAVASKNERPKLSPAQQELLDHILGLRETQQQRAWELMALCRKAESDTERYEIANALAEVLFRPLEAVAATDINSELTDSAEEALAKHREHVARRIKRLRNQKKMTQEDLAEKSGLPQSHVCRLEAGKHAPTYLTIERLAKALGVRMSDIDLSYDD